MVWSLTSKVILLLQAYLDTCLWSGNVCPDKSLRNKIISLCAKCWFIFCPPWLYQKNVSEHHWSHSLPFLHWWVFFSCQFCLTQLTLLPLKCLFPAVFKSSGHIFPRLNKPSTTGFEALNSLAKVSAEFRVNQERVYMFQLSWNSTVNVFACGKPKLKANLGYYESSKSKIGNLNCSA